MSWKEYVSFKVPKKLKDRMDKLKKHRREPYYEVLERLLDCWDNWEA